ATRPTSTPSGSSRPASRRRKARPATRSASRRPGARGSRRSRPRWWTSTRTARSTSGKWTRRGSSGNVSRTDPTRLGAGVEPARAWEPLEVGVRFERPVVPVVGSVFAGLSALAFGPPSLVGPGLLALLLLVATVTDLRWGTIPN